MSETQLGIPYSTPRTDYSLHTQEQLLALASKGEKFSIGLPKELSLQENRIALTPTSVQTLVSHGHRITIETNAGEKSYFSDFEYSEAGAEIVFSPQEVYKADVILRAAPPSLSEIDWMHPNQILISPLQMPTIEREYIQKLKQKRVIALAMEYIKDDSDTFPIVGIMSELAGLTCILIGAELMANAKGSRGKLLGGISGVPSSKVVILGAGIVAEFATRAALGLGAEVRIFDDNMYKLKRLQNFIGRPLYTSSLNPVYLERELSAADLVIGAIHSKTGRTQVVVSEDMVNKMRPGTVIIDVSIDQGGCFATSRVTTHDKPTFEEFGVIHYCVPNIASKMSRTASMAISNIMTPILLKAGSVAAIEALLTTNPGLRHGVYTYKGCLTNEYLGERFDIKSTNLDLLLTAFM